MKLKTDNKLSKGKRVVLAVVLLSLIITAIYLLAGSHQDRLIGELEADIVPNVCEVSGKIVEVYAAPGQEVKTGDILALIDSLNQQYALEQLQISLQQAMLTLGEAKGGSQTAAGSNLLAAQAAYSSAAASAAQARDNYQRTLVLYNDGAVSQSVMEQARLASQTAADAETMAKAKLNAANSSYSKENAALAVSKLQVQVSQAQELLDKYTIRAACDGVVVSRNYTKGSMVAVGYDLVDIVNTAERYLVVYLPQQLMGNYDYDQVLTVTYNGANYSGTIKYIDVKSGYAPKDLQTAANRSRDTIKVKLLLPSDCPIKAGETAEVLL